MVIFHKTQKKLKNLLTESRFFGKIPFQINDNSLENHMSKSVYTDQMVATMSARAPLNAEICSELASEFGNGITSRSVIAKAKSLGLDYTVKAKPARKKAAASKADIVNAIAKAVDADAGSLDGLVKAPANALSALLSNLS